MAHTIPRFIHHPHSPLSVLLPPPTTTPSLFSNHHHTPQGHCAHPLPTLLPHTHTWCGWHVPLWLLSRPVCGVCGWHAHPITSSTHTQPQPLWLCPSPHHHSLVCVCAWKHVPHGHAQPPTTHLHGVVFSLSSQVRAIKPFAIHPVCVVDWWLACVGVATCVSACVLVGCVAFHHTVCRVCLHALIHLCHHTLLLLCCCCCWW